MDDLFDDVLNLEEQAYQEGYEQGRQDGAEAGRIEGLSVGLKKGFEKFFEAGRLQSKALIWANRLPNFQTRESVEVRLPLEGQTVQPQHGEERKENEDLNTREMEICKLTPLNSNPRLARNVAMLYGLVEPGTLSTRNEDEDVNDFDGRMKGAQGKLRMIERVVGETNEKSAASQSTGPSAKNESIEDMGRVQGQSGTAKSSP
ncbi:DUF1715-domain-containing protein [Xylariaceae sp. FL0016]|nr:DUF1715-domain-containing protein [Xylariaceae sp. FL0016]